MLKPGGQIFLQFFTYNGLVDMWIEVAFSERWNSYTKVKNKYLLLFTKY